MARTNVADDLVEEEDEVAPPDLIERFLVMVLRHRVGITDHDADAALHAEFREGLESTPEATLHQQRTLLNTEITRYDNLLDECSREPEVTPEEPFFRDERAAYTDDMRAVDAQLAAYTALIAVVPNPPSPPNPSITDITQTPGATSGHGVLDWTTRITSDISGSVYIFWDMEAETLQDHINWVAAQIGQPLTITVTGGPMPGTFSIHHNSNLSFVISDPAGTLDGGAIMTIDYVLIGSGEG